ncbi:MAG: hypothetical protein PHP51_03210 [Desulfotomaculaceae bacterium]|nr:hypothetical protein [Desulfotomaculaceae bacterium]MDD4766527.1 hypothetical protein [Desulfotomaculaceae bacterium]
MIEQLKVNIGKTVVIELVNGRKISGTVMSAEQRYVRLQSDEGIGVIPVEAVYIVWEAPSRTLTNENMDQIAEKLRDSVKAEIACNSFPGFNCAQSYICRPPDTCTFNFSCPGSYVPGGGGSQCDIFGGFACQGAQFYGFVGPGQMQQPSVGMAGEDPQANIACTSFPGFTCARSYICRPPDTCTFSFACPGSYAPSFPSGGGACPFFACGPFQFNQPCGPFTFGGCGPFQFGQPCAFLFQCGTFQFAQPCGPFQFSQPCSPFIFGGSQCGIPGGFACGGQEFIGIAPAGSTPGTPAGPPKPPLSPMELSMLGNSQSEEKKETKE